MSEASRTLPNLRVDASDLSPVAVLVGDPARARDAAARLDEAREIGANREFVTWTGLADGERITVASHGAGAAGANVCFVELIQGGVRALIRAGTCGAIEAGLASGDLVLATGAVREEGVSDQLIPAAYPAIADRRLTDELAGAAARAGRPVREGLVVTIGNFYPHPAAPRWLPYRGHGALAVDMELSSLFVVASLYGARAAGILAVDGNLVEDRDPGMSDYDPHRAEVASGISAMLDIAIEGAARVARAERARAVSTEGG